MEPVQPPPNTQPTTPQIPTSVSGPTQMAGGTEIPIPQKSSKSKINMASLKEKFNKFPKNTKIAIIVVGVLFFILFVLSILSAMFGKKQTTVVITPSPSPVSVTPIPNVVLGASRYATDSGVLKIETDLNNFQQQLDSSDVKQSDLSIPNVDYNINFNQ